MRYAINCLMMSAMGRPLIYLQCFSTWLVLPTSCSFDVVSLSHCPQHLRLVKPQPVKGCVQSVSVSVPCDVIEQHPTDPSDGSGTIPPGPPPWVPLCVDWISGDSVIPSCWQCLWFGVEGSVSSHQGRVWSNQNNLNACPTRKSHLNT